MIFSPLLIQNYHFKKSFCSLAPSPLTPHRSVPEPGILTPNPEPRCPNPTARCSPLCLWCGLLCNSLYHPHCATRRRTLPYRCYHDRNTAWPCTHTQYMTAYDLSPTPAVTFGKWNRGRITTAYCGQDQRPDLEAGHEPCDNHIGFTRSTRLQNGEPMR